MMFQKESLALDGIIKKNNIKRILLIQSNAELDIRFTEEFLRAIKKNSNIHLTLLARSSASTLHYLQKQRSIYELLVYKDSSSYIDYLTFIRSQSFDLILLLIRPDAIERFIHHYLSFLAFKSRKKIIIFVYEDYYKTINSFHFFLNFLSTILTGQLSLIKIYFLKPVIIIKQLFRRRKKIDPKIVKKILWVRLDHIGDVVMAGIMLDPLKRQFPNAKIDALVGPWCSQLLSVDPRINEIIEYPAPWHNRTTTLSAGKNETKLLIKNLQKKNYDIVIESRGNFFDSLIAYKSGAKITVGTIANEYYNRLRLNNKFLLTYAVDYGKSLKPIIQHHLAIAHTLGCLIKDTDREKVFFDQNDKKKALEILNRFYVETKDRTYLKVALHIGCGESTRKWPQTNFVELVKRIYQKNKYVKFFLIGSNVDLDSITELKNTLNEDMTGAIISVAGKFNLTELGAFLSLMDLVIGNDTGPIHIANAVGTKTMAIYLKQFALMHSPSSPRVKVISTKDESNPIESISVEEVLQTVENIIKEILQKKMHAEKL